MDLTSFIAAVGKAMAVINELAGDLAPFIPIIQAAGQPGFVPTQADFDNLAALEAESRSALQSDDAALNPGEV